MASEGLGSSQEEEEEPIIQPNNQILPLKPKKLSLLSSPPMTTWVLSECGFRPLPPLCPRPRTGTISSSSKARFLNTKNNGVVRTDLGFNCGGLIREKRRLEVLRVSAPLRVGTAEGDKEERINGVVAQEFDPGAPPPFTLAEIRAAIPKHCWVKNPWRSMSYVVRDVIVVLGLAVVAAYVNSWLVWPLYWAAQGTMFWAVFVLGHDW